MSTSATVRCLGRNKNAFWGSRNYTHIDMVTKRKAVDSMPDVLAVKAEAKKAKATQKALIPHQLTCTES